MIHKYDVVIVGAGGAGLQAAIEIPTESSCAVLTKVFPTRSHTGTAQGGVSAALGNEEEDSWEWHAFDTVKGGDYLGDQDAIETMCKDAIRAIIELEHMGMPFNRTPEGKIAQRMFGGHTANFGKKPVRRACYSADRTGHVMLQTLYEQCIKNDVTFFSEFHVMDLIIRDGVCRGLVAIEIKTGEIHIFHAKAVMFATGGYGRVFQITSNAMAGTGDGFEMAYRNGVPLEDMEFVQFHPTGLWKLGILVSEAARGEGGILRNKDGERFMERYAPSIKDLAPRDMVSRAIFTEIKEGRGIEAPDGSFYVGLDLTHLGKELIEEKLPEITGFAKTYLGVDANEEWIPVQPTTHYAMGGIPTTIDAEVIVDENNTTMPGFYAAGECACVSVHGANRLGTNSLLDILVFGRRGGKKIAKFIVNADYPELPDDASVWTHETIERIRNNDNNVKMIDVRSEMQKTMMDTCSVFRVENTMKEGLQKIKELQEKYLLVGIDDKSKGFNTDLLEVAELGSLLNTAETIITCAIDRTESRGAHSRDDYPKRDDANWLKHSLIFATTGSTPDIRYKPVIIKQFEPKERVY
ncbi:MAG: succinate dehydrogenase flavoprotein subunit [Candidatus Marinimicrobia bacterium]|nr:succinate dehydrogenase flavoprotein subunit [Candidatus Neomarinimicrobiota bacterium]